MYIASSVHNTRYPTRAQHHIHTTLHIHMHTLQYYITNRYITPSIPNTKYETFTQHYLYYTMYITLHNQHVHTLNIYHTTCKQHHRCKKYNIYDICTTILQHIQNHTDSLPGNLASSVLSILVLACYKTHFLHFADVSLGIT